MIYDLSGGIGLNVSDQLDNDLYNFFSSKSSTTSIKTLIDCDLKFQNVVRVAYKDASFEFQRNNWIAQLFQLLPQIYMITLPQFVFLHGSCFCVNNKIVLLLGHSKSGKSTALYNILCKNEFNYISDEIIAIESNEKYLLPFSNKPIQLRQDAIIKNDHIFVDDAWNMGKITYVCPELKEANCLSFSDYHLTLCFLKYFEDCVFEVESLNGYNLLNSLFHSCFNISKTALNLLTTITEQNVSAFNIKYNGNVEPLVEVIL